MLRRVLTVMMMVAFLAVAGCGKPTSQAMTQKAAGIKTKQELEKAFGKPDNFSKMGPIETWTYKTSDGEVTFLITGDSVQMSAGGSSSKKE